ncbi:MAG: ABC transporter ATP-binding protein [Nitrospinae bacterium]|nr:ABC transporter ATP-binding protein [Nitrospinota bacterium]
MENIVKTYLSAGVETPVLKGIDLRIEEGEYASVIGPSGAGKSTLMTIMGCLGSPTSGKYILDGEEVETLNDAQLSRARNEKIGFVFQAFHLLPGVKAIDNVMMPLLYCHKVPADARERARESLEKVGLAHRLHHSPGQLSGGEQQRVTIARALVNDPRIILADEPTGNLDSKNGAEVMRILDQLNREGRTIVIITHDPKVAQHGRRTISLMDGRILEDRRHESVTQFEGSPSRAGSA